MGAVLFEDGARPADDNAATLMIEGSCASRISREDGDEKPLLRLV
jgi:hypothetical protein